MATSLFPTAAAPPPPPQVDHLVEMLRRRAQRQADDLAYTFLADGESVELPLSYAQLDRRARAIAVELKRRGLAGSRALLVYDPGLEYIAAFFGCLYAGVIAVPIYPPDPLRIRRTWSRLQAILLDAQAPCVLCESPLLDWADGWFAGIPQLEHVIATDRIGGDDAHRWEPPDLSSDSLAFLQYTSGSTGDPKGVMLSHGNLLHNLTQMHRRLDSDKVVGVSWLPPYHDLGLIAGVLLPVFSGRRTVLMSPLAFVQRPLRWLQAITRYRGMTSGGPNFAYDLCVRKISPEDRAALDLSSWTVALNGAEPVRAETLERFAEAFAPCGFRRQAFYPAFGLAEATLKVSGGVKGRGSVIRAFRAAALGRGRAERVAADDDDARRLVGCGHSIADQRIAIVDPETCVEVGSREVGEIWVRGPSIARGYWNRPELSRQTFQARLAGSGEGPFLRTGDLGFVDRGELFITGRLKELMILRGRNVYPQDVEYTVQRCHASLRSNGGAAFSVNGDREERLVVVHEVNAPRRVDLPRLIDSVRQAILEEHDVDPHAVVFIPNGSLPKTSSGKIQRRACRDDYLAGRLRPLAEWSAEPNDDSTPPPFEAPRGDVESPLAAIWSEVLGLEQVGRHDNFFDHGGQSLLAAQLLARVNETFDVELELRSLFEAPTLAELADVIATCDTTVDGHTPIARAEAEQYPLTPMQRQLWFVHELEPDLPCYHVAVQAEVEGELNAAALEASLQQLVARHDALRATFTSVDGVPQQRIAEQLSIPLEIVDLAGMAAAERDAELKCLADEHARRTFDLERGPVVRAAVVRLGDRHQTVLFCAHHLICDGWSLGILLREWAALYAAQIARAAPALDEPPVRYVDYAAWQDSAMKDSPSSAGWRYWTNRLRDSVPLELPADRPTRSEPYRGDQVAVELPAELAEALSSFARRRGATLYMTLLASFQVLLSRITGQTDVRVGTPVAHRTRKGLETLVGLVANSLILRSDLGGDPRFDDFLTQVRESTLEALAHQDLPLEAVVAELGPHRDAGRDSLFEVFFAFEEFPAETSALGDLRIDRWEVDYRYMVPAEWSLFIEQRGRRLWAVMAYDASRYEAERIERLLAGWQALLERVVVEPRAKVSALPVMPEAERQFLLVDLNDTRAALPNVAGAEQLVSQQAKRSPQKVAVEMRCAGETPGPQERSLTYEELDRRGNQLARYLASRGVGRGTLVGIYLNRSPQMLVALLGVWKAGAAYVPLDPAYPAERLRWMLSDSAAPIVISDEQLAQTLPADDVEVIRLDTDRVAIDLQPANPLDISRSGDDLAYVIYTSGSTGRPKGVEITHRAVVNFLASMARQPGLSFDDVLLAVTTLSFDIAVLELFGPLVVGGRVVVADRRDASDAEALAALIEESGATVMQATPATWQMLAAADWRGSANLNKMLVGGEALPQPLAARLFECGGELWNLYGPTETTVWSAAARITEAAGPIPIGHPIANTEIHLLDANQQLVPLGVPGELCIGGVGLARGYRNLPEETAARFAGVRLPDGRVERFYRTGDVARRRADGTLDFLGRRDQQVKLRGHRIELGEIETALCQHRQVEQAVAIIREDRPGDARLVAYYRPIGADAAALRSHLADVLPDYMIPAALVGLDEFPQTPNGKIDRRALPEPDSTLSDRRIPAELPQTETERQLADLWRQVLGHAAISRADNFFHVGGHSLLATQLVSRIRHQFDVELPLRACFEHPTLEGLAARIDTARIESRRPDELPPIRRRGDDEPPVLSFAQRRLWFLDQLEPDHPFYNLPIAARLDGPLDVVALERSLKAIIARHEPLRTAFTCEHGEPRATIHDAVDFALETIDLTAFGVADRERELDRQITELARRPFDLSRAPLIRGYLFRLAAERHVALLAMHHIVSDGWSLGVMLSELAALYPTFAAGESLALGPPPVRYRDYAVWQNEWLASETLERQLDYWRRQLRDLPPRLELPTDLPRPEAQSFRGAALPWHVPAEVVRGLEEIASQHGATLYMVLVAAYQALLSRYSGQEDLCLGTPVANRRRTELENLVGLFVNTLVLRGDLSGDPTFVELLGRTRSTTLDAYAHQDVPFERLVEELAPERTSSHAPIFQAALVLQNAPLALPAAGPLSIEPLPVDTGTAKHDLTLLLRSTSDGLTGVWEYNTDLFVAETAARMARHFGNLLAGIVADPRQRLSELSLLDATEERRVLVDFNATPTGQVPRGCLHERVELHAQRRGDAVALELDTKQLTYAELNRRASAVARRLRELGVGPDVLVAITTERSLDTMVGLLGILKAGGAFVPLDADYPVARQALILQETAAEIVVATREQMAKLADAVTGSARIVCMEDILDELPADAAVRNPTTGVTPDNLAYCIFTSGSTGTPKGVLLEHGGLWTRIVSLVERLEITRESRVLQFASLNFDAAVAEIFAAWFQGATLVLAREEELLPGPALASLLRQQAVSVVTLPPSVLAALSQEELPALRTLVTAGEACSGELVARWSPGRLFVNGYGPTETTIGATSYRCQEVSGRPPIGRPFDHTRVYVLDEHRQPAPIGVPGEIYVAGAGLARSYLNRPELTAERFVPDPFVGRAGARMYRTGDRGRWLADGNLEFLGRTDHQVKLRGYRIELGEIEAVLREQAEVDQAVVIAREDEPGDKRLVAYVTRRADANGDNPSAAKLVENRQLDEWRTVFDTNYRQVVPHEDAAFNISGWNSSYTGRPIPADEMRRWIEATVERITECRPRRVLEVGCGSGLVLYRVAPHCDEYWATDISGEALRYVERVLETPGRQLQNVRLLERAADDFAGLPAGAFDMIVLNSVVQYFPTVDYLMRVLEGIVPLVRPGGRIYLGDVRSLPLLGALHASIELHQADDSVTRQELLERVQRRIEHEEELAVDPALFTALRRYLPAIKHVDVQLKRGDYVNELSKFRYEVMLTVGAQPPRLEGLSLDWSRPGHSLESIERRLRHDSPESLTIRHVSNLRVERDVRAWDLIRQTDGPATVGQLRQALEAQDDAIADATIDPQAFWQLGQRAGYDVQVTWSESAASGDFDVLFRRHRPPVSGNGNGHHAGNAPPVRSPGGQPPGGWHLYANNPVHSALLRELVPQWKRHLDGRLPAHMVPASFLLLDRLPLTAAGKIDRRALPAPLQTRPSWSGRFVAPRDALETQIARIWEEVLCVEPVGVTDNFFELGGHSMLAVRMMARIEEDCGRALPLVSLFREPTVEHLAQLLRRAGSDEPPSILVPLQPQGSEAPFFCVHPAGGTVFCYVELARHLGTERPFYGLQAAGIDGRMPHETIEQMATDYIAAIRDVAPQGPYHLGGWSLGGNIAFEIARQLAEQGHEVALLALFDAGTMPTDRPPEEGDFLPVVMGLFPGEKLPSLEELRQLPPEQQLQEFVTRAQRAQLVAPEVNSAQAQQLFEVFQSNLKGILSYRPRPYPGRVTLFRAAEQATSVGEDPELGWGEFAAGGVEVHTIPGDHVHMMREPNVRKLAEALRGCFERIEEKAMANKTD